MSKRQRPVENEDGSLRLRFKKARTNINLNPLDSQKNIPPVDDPFPRDYSQLVWLLVGKRGTGKTSLICRTADGPYSKYFTNLFFISPTATRDGKIGKVIQRAEETGKFYLPHSDIQFTACVKDIIDRVSLLKDKYERDLVEYKEHLERYNKLRDEDKKKIKPPLEPLKPNTLVLVDDCIHLFGNHAHLAQCMAELIFLSRHKGTHLWICTQDYMGALPSMRKHCDMITVFSSITDRDVITLQNELTMNADTFRTLLSRSVSVPYSFIHIVFVNAVARCFIKQFDEILYVDLQVKDVFSKSAFDPSNPTMYLSIRDYFRLTKGQYKRMEQLKIEMLQQEEEDYEVKMNRALIMNKPQKRRSGREFKEANERKRLKQHPGLIHDLQFNKTNVKIYPKDVELREIRT